MVAMTAETPFAAIKAGSRAASRTDFAVQRELGAVTVDPLAEEELQQLVVRLDRPGGLVDRGRGRRARPDRVDHVDLGTVGLLLEHIEPGDRRPLEVRLHRHQPRLRVHDARPVAAGAGGRAPPEGVAGRLRPQLVVGGHLDRRPGTGRFVGFGWSNASAVASSKVSSAPSTMPPSTIPPSVSSSLWRIRLKSTVTSAP